MMYAAAASWAEVLNNPFLMKIYNPSKLLETTLARMFFLGSPAGYPLDSDKKN